ncbi:aminotransferase class I/II-fold pyridoxal phosphate-dependent enzyme [Ochrobactrum sp. Marseille-Q0166]|uniref:aminotransferase class I/II-fold pyridoxal phosphate-dependent enzyme n=1 Tax=Ochrobactrum sp. Marseille-Q0166 TaxID=2761105 RepID=UPI0032B3637D
MKISTKKPGNNSSILGKSLATPAMRSDQWLTVLSEGRFWVNGDDSRIEAIRQVLDGLETIERFFAYPGDSVLSKLHARLNDGDARGFLRAAQNISTSIISQKYMADISAWDNWDADDSQPAERLPQAINHIEKKPYFEVLSVVPHITSRWQHIAREARSIRRPEDEFIYETVVTGNAEDALTAILINPSIASVVLYEGFAAKAAETNPLITAISEVIDLAEIKDDSRLALRTARAIKKIRPELDIYLLSDREIEHLAGDPDNQIFSRLFYQVEEPLELHLSILEGVHKRYQTPFFDNLKHYAARPIATFHALPIARGKAVFKSNWIRDMGEFYGPNLFLAESSATTGGLDSLLEPTGNIKEAQELAARAFGADHVFFVTNGTSTSNKMVLQALLAPGDIVIIDRNCHKSHHYGCVLAGAQPYYVEAFPLTEYSMYGAVSIHTIKQALLTLRAEGQLDRVKMIDLTNCTFDGHVYNTRRVMEECLAIKPDLIFLWDEAWFGFAHWSPFLRQRTAMGAAQTLEDYLATSEAKQAWQNQQKELGESPSDDVLLSTRLIPDPDAVRLRVYQTNSIHKSMSALRQGSVVLVRDVEFNDVEAQFHEAVFTHASTSPNLQIIASLDVARRQMELEGYGLVSNALQIALEIRKQINGHPLISKYFRVLNNAEMVPAEFRESNVTDFNDASLTWTDAVKAVRDDEFLLDPSRMTLSCGAAGFDGTNFKNMLADRFNIQVNKTSRNSILLQSNINNSRSDVALLVRVLLEISQEIDASLKEGGEARVQNFAAKVRTLVEVVPNLPNFSKFDDRYRGDPKSATLNGDIRSAFYDAYKKDECEFVPLHDSTVDERIEKGPALVSANFVIPYPPGFPIMVPGQVITREIIEFMRKLDVKEIHGYDKAAGLKVLKRS